MSNVALDKTPHNWLKNIESLFDAQQAWRDGTYRNEVFAQYLVPTDTPFTICCGVGLLAAHVRKFKFTPKLIASLGRIVDQAGRPVFEESFLNHLQRLSLRVELAMPLEGMLLLPGQPLGILRGNLLQILLLRTALEELIAQSTYWATHEAMKRWKSLDLVEEDTPTAPILPANRGGWQLRAKYIGGSNNLQLNEDEHTQASELRIFPVEKRDSVLGQIRRLFDGNRPLADVHMTEPEDLRSSVSKTSLQLKLPDHSIREVHYTRFVKLYQPVLVKGHPVLASPQLAIRRQRTLHQMQSYQHIELSKYCIGAEHNPDH